MRSIPDFNCPDCIFTTHVLLMFMWLSDCCSSCACLADNSTQNPQRKTISCDQKCLQIGFLQVVVILIKEEIEMCFEHFVPFSFKCWAGFKKCWHAMKVRERPTRSDGLNAYSEQNKSLTTERLDSFFCIGDTKHTVKSFNTLSFLCSSGITCMCVCV